MADKQKDTSNANQILHNWLKSTGKSIAAMCRECGYISGYPYQILQKHNPRPVTHELIGRLLVVYGAKGPAVAMAEAMRKVSANGNGKHAP